MFNTGDMRSISLYKWDEVGAFAHPMAWINAQRELRELCKAETGYEPDGWWCSPDGNRFTMVFYNEVAWRRVVDILYESYLWMFIDGSPEPPH